MREFIKWLCAIVLIFGVQCVRAESSQLDIECEWGKISATLTVPDQGSETVVIIIAGSGPTDRDGNSLGAGLRSYSYAMLADELVADGLAALRYDKRAIGQSQIPATDVPNLVIEDYVDDAEQIVRAMRDRGFKRVVLAGHSEGGLIALIAAERQRVELDGVVLLAAAGYSIDSILLTQLGAQLIPANIPLMYQAQTIIKSLKSGEQVAQERVPTALMSLFHPVVQPFLISEMQYDPRQLIARVETPVMIVSGGRDVQVSVANGEALAAAQPKAEHRIFENMCHVLKDAASSDRVQQILGEYSNSSLPLSQGLTSSVVEFINNIK